MKEWVSVIIHSMSTINFRQGFISRLLANLTIVALLSSPSFAEEALIYPDSAQISFDWTADQDTVTVLVQNYSIDPVTNLFISDFTDSSTIFISCLIDGVNVDSIPIDPEFGTVYPNKYTTRWLISDFSDSLILKYHCPAYNSFQINFSAGVPFPVFGFMPSIGAPREVSWQEDP